MLGQVFLGPSSDIDPWSGRSRQRGGEGLVETAADEPRSRRYKFGLNFAHALNDQIEKCWRLVHPIAVPHDGDRQNWDGRDGHGQRNVGKRPNDEDGIEEDRLDENGKTLKWNEFRRTSWIMRNEEGERETEVLLYHQGHPESQESFRLLDGTVVEKDAGGDQEDAEDNLGHDANWKQRNEKSN